MATIIKKDSEFYPSGKRLSVMALDMVDVEGQVDQYIEQVQAQAAEIVQKAQQEADTIRAQSEQAGRTAAEAAIDRILEKKVAKQMQTLTPALQAAVKQIEDSRQEWLQTWETRTLQLACAIAQKIVRRELQNEPELPLQWISESLKLCGKAAEILVRLHPTDHTTLGNQVAELANQFAPAAETKIIADPNLSPGGCKVETEFGSIDQQIETQLERIIQEMQ